MRRRENHRGEEFAVSNKIDNGAGAPARRTAGPVRREGGPFPSDTTSLVRALGPIDGTMIVIGSIDRAWHLHRFSGVIAIEWRAGLVVARLGARWIADDDRRAVLLGTGNDDGASRRGLEVAKIVQNTFTVAKRAALTAVVVIGLSLAW